MTLSKKHNVPMWAPAGLNQTLATLGLMPGTVGIELDGDRLHIHALDSGSPVAAEIRALEDAIAALFGEAE